MNNPATLNAMAAALDAKELAAEGERSPKLKAAYDAAVSANTTANTALAAVYAAAKAVTDKLSAQGATIEGAATEIAALIALYPTE